MEMYTNDLIDLVNKYNRQLLEYDKKHGGWAANEMMYDMQMELRRIIKQRLKEHFEELIIEMKDENRSIELEDLTDIIKEL